VFGVSDSIGSFAARRLTGRAASGPYPLRLPACRTSMRWTEEREDVTLAVLLDVVAAELAPIVVEAQTIRAERSLVGFYDRRKWTVGRFYTRADLDQRARTRWTGCWRVRRTSGVPCRELPADRIGRRAPVRHVAVSGTG